VKFVGKILRELEKSRYWDESMQRIQDKRFLGNEDKLEVSYMHYLKGKDYYLDMIKSGQFQFGVCEKRELKKPGSNKVRVVYISSLEERYILGALYRACTEVFKDVVSPNVFSYKRQTGTVHAMEYLMGDGRIHEKVGLKMDISAYFNSVREESLRSVVDEVTEDDLEIRKMLESLLFCHRVKFKGEEITEYKSLVPGNPFSSFLANYCLKELDISIVKEFGMTYARYSDDIVIFANNHSELSKGASEVSKMLEIHGLKLNEKKYEEFKPMDEISYLGLKLFQGVVDISDESREKFKRKIKKSVERGRRAVERDGKDPYKEAQKLFREFNSRVYKSYLRDKKKFGWAYYSFRYVNTMETLRELDFYLKDRARYLITGKNNRANHRSVPDSVLEELGYQSLCKMFKMFKSDFDYYCDSVDLM